MFLFFLDNMLVYLSATTGYRAGGFNLGYFAPFPSYDQEEVLMIELDREHLEYSRKLHMMFRDRRPETYSIISTSTDKIQRK